MSPIIAKEMSPENRAQRHRRLLMLKLSLKENRYEVDADRVARGIIDEALEELASLRLIKN